MAVLVTGDGGWAGIDQEIAGTLAEGGRWGSRVQFVEILVDATYARRFCSRLGTNTGILPEPVAEAKGHCYWLLHGCGSPTVCHEPFAAGHSGSGNAGSTPCPWEERPVRVSSVQLGSRGIRRTG